MGFFFVGRGCCCSGKIIKTGESKGRHYLRKIGCPHACMFVYMNPKSQRLTCHMQVQRCSFGSIVILPRRRHSVDPHGSVDVFDAILNGAHVGVGESVAISEVQRNACPCAVALHRGRKKKTKQLISNTYWGCFPECSKWFDAEPQTILNYITIYFLFFWLMIKINIYNQCKNKKKISIDIYIPQGKITFIWLLASLKQSQQAI